MTGSDVDAVVIGAGPNGLAAAVTLARAGLSVRVFELAAQPGGGASTAALTLPGFRHDVCSAVHPLAFESRFFQEFGLADRVPFIVPELSFAHPLDGGRAGLAYRDLDRTARALGRDGARYAALLRPLVERSAQVAQLTGDTLLRLPRDIPTALRFALTTLGQSGPWWNARFRDEEAPALLTGAAAHTILPLPSLASSAAGLTLSVYAHARGWPIPVGGSQAITDALVRDLIASGGEVATGHRVRSLDEVADCPLVLCDVTPRALIALAGERMPRPYRRSLERFRYGHGVAKVDFALSEPVPWTNAASREAGTLHLGGTRTQIAAAENAVVHGRLPDAPYVLVSQPSVHDHSRAPEGKHTLWAYTHVPHGCDVDRTEAVTAQIERFAPGFRDTILASSSRTAVHVARHNPNYPGGDISAGTPDLRQLLRRPVLRADPWRTPMPGVYLCSASTTPGPGVHGLAGWHAALSALRRHHGIRTPPGLAPR